MRQGVEVPSQGERKDMAPEMLNRQFFWVDDDAGSGYYNYPDWKLALSGDGFEHPGVYDSFNLNVLPSQGSDEEHRYYYQDNARRVPKGVFPRGDGTKREVVLYDQEAKLRQLLENREKNQELLLKADPSKAMLLEELG